MKAIILAAGMGTRLSKYTQELPKGMLDFFGKSLIQRQVELFRSCGVENIIIVTGYQKEKVNILGVKYYNNNNYSSTNMVETLFCAEEELNDDVIVSYSDVIYTKDVLQKVIDSKVSAGVTIDDSYWDYWQARMENPLLDIESLIIDGDGKIIDLGDTNCSLEEAKVRYVGLLKFSSLGVEHLKKVYHKNKDLFFLKDEPWLRSKSFKKAYMTCMLKALINEGYRVEPIYISHGWMEFDTNEDYENAIEWNKNGELDRFIKLDK